MFKLLRNGFDYLSAKPVRFFLAAALLWMIIMGVLNALNGIQWNDILVEANGMAFDLLVFGVLLSLYEALRDKKDKIERLQEEIYDYGGWNEKEATFRIAGAIKRLNKLGITQIHFAKSYLDNADLINANLEGSVFLRADMHEVKLAHSNLKHAKVYESNLEGINLVNADLSGIVIIKSNLKSAQLGQVNLDKLMEKQNIKRIDLENSDSLQLILPGANLNGATLRENDLEGAIVGLDWFEKIEGWNVFGRDEIFAKYRINENGILQLK